MPLPDSRMSRRVFRACTLAACSPRSTGIDPTDSKNAFIARPLKPLVVKYSAFAKKATGRGMRAWTMTLSKKDRWFGATIKGPSLGTFSSPMTVGRQLPEMRVRVVQRTASKTAIVGYLAQGRPTDSIKFFNFCAQLCGGPDDGDGTRRFQLAVRGNPQLAAYAIEGVRRGPANARLRGPPPTAWLELRSPTAPFTISVFSGAVFAPSYSSSEAPRIEAKKPAMPWC